MALEPEVFANLRKYAESFYGPRNAAPAVAPACGTASRQAASSDRGTAKLTGYELKNLQSKPLRGCELTPLGLVGGPGLFENIAAVEMALVVEDFHGVDCDPLLRVVSQT